MIAITDAAHREAQTIDAWLTAARQRQAKHVGPMPPRMTVEHARTMASCMGMTPEVAEPAALAMAFWQVFVPSVLGSDRDNFADVSSRLPRSYAIVRDAVASYAGHRQLIYAAYHMTGFPLLAAMLIPAVFEAHGGRGHALVGHRNMAWLRTDAGRWVTELADVISTDARGLRELQTGLRDGSIRRLLILVDGPHRPGPGTHPLTGITPELGFKTGLIRRLVELNIPILPVTHVWENDALEIEWQPLLTGDAAAACTTIAGQLESLLRRHPEQWMNWPAARAALAR